jgi:hypothetical protein
MSLLIFYIKGSKFARLSNEGDLLFIKVVGGAYFFLPGVRALHYLTTM